MQNIGKENFMAIWSKVLPILPILIFRELTQFSRKLNIKKPQPTISKLIAALGCQVGSTLI